jgi:membrane-associated protein
MDFIHHFIDTFLKLDYETARTYIEQYGNLIYLILFLIIFTETGLVIWPWLPGDSLLFLAGTFAAIGSLNIVLLIVVCMVAAILGNSSNYLIGRYFSERALQIKFRGKVLVKKEYLDKTHAFYEKYGPNTLVITRFVPIIRTISPFVAGIGKMTYTKFTLYNILGALIWVPVMTMLGYLFGNNDFVREHFEMVALAIIFLSVLPIFYGIIKHRMQRKPL